MQVAVNAYQINLPANLQIKFAMQEKKGGD